MKKSIFLGLLLLATTVIFGQATIESIVIEKHNRNAVKLYVDQSVKITTNALKARLSRSGLNGKTKKGVTIYRGVILSELSATKLDIYTRVQQSGIGSVVYMAASRGYDNFSSPEDNEITNNIVTFLNTFKTDAGYRSIDLNLTAQNDNIIKQEKVYRKLLDEQKDTEKKKSDADVKLIQLQNDIDAKKIELDKLKAALEELKAKRAYMY